MWLAISWSQTLKSLRPYHRTNQNRGRVVQQQKSYGNKARQHAIKTCLVSETFDGLPPPENNYTLLQRNTDCFQLPSQLIRARCSDASRKERDASKGSSSGGDPTPRSGFRSNSSINDFRFVKQNPKSTGHQRQFIAQKPWVDWGLGRSVGFGQWFLELIKQRPTWPCSANLQQNNGGEYSRHYFS